MSNDWTPPPPAAPGGPGGANEPGDAPVPPPPDGGAPPPPTTPPPPPAPPPPGGGVAGPPGAPPPVVPTPAGDSEPSRRKPIGVLVSVVVLIAAAVFGIVWITGGGGDSEASGADSPEALGDEVLDVIANRDVLGGVDLLLPGERATFRQPMIDLVDELERLEILDGADLSGVPGFGVELTDREVEVEETNVGDVVHINISGTAAVNVDPGDFPLGSVIQDRLDDADIDLTEEEIEPVEEELTLPLVGVEDDGEWYLSLGYTVGESVRAYTYDQETGAPLDIPEEGVQPAGGDSPEEAVEVAAQAIASLDVEAMIAALNPNEAAALQRYAPLFLEDAQAALDDQELDVEITDLQTRVEGSGSRRHVYVDAVSVTMTAPNYDGEDETITAEYADGCFHGTYEGADDEESVEYCYDEGMAEVEEELDRALEEFPDPDQAREFIETLDEAFADYEMPGIIVAEVDGEWYVSPIATGADSYLAVLRALDVDELNDLIDQGAALAEDMMDELFQVGEFDDIGEFEIEDPLESPDDFETEITIPDDFDTDITIPDDFETDYSIPDITIPDDFETDYTIPDITIPDDFETDYTIPDITIPDLETED